MIPSITIFNQAASLLGEIYSFSHTLNSIIEKNAGTQSGSYSIVGYVNQIYALANYTVLRKTPFCTRVLFAMESLNREAFWNNLKVKRLVNPLNKNLFFKIKASDIVPVDPVFSINIVGNFGEFTESYNPESFLTFYESKHTFGISFLDNYYSLRQDIQTWIDSYNDADFFELTTWVELVLDHIEPFMEILYSILLGLRDISKVMKSHLIKIFNLMQHLFENVHNYFDLKLGTASLLLDISTEYLKTLPVKE